MQDETLIEVPGHPVGKGRARSVLRGFKTTATGKRAPVIGHYTPDKTRTWEGIARTLAMNALRGRLPTREPVLLHLRITLPVPASWPQWKQALALDGRIAPTVKPDADNVEKAVKDALNGVAWHDDCQVVQCIKAKHYGAAPGVRIIIRPLGMLPAQVKRKPESTTHA